MSFMVRYVWLIAIGFTLANAAYLIIRSRPRVEADPSLAEGYATLARGMALWMNVPWIVMGVGLTLGGVRSPWTYFNPPGSNPFVLAWYASVVGLWVGISWWILAGGGAEMLVKHPGVFRKGIDSPRTVKAFWVLVQLGGLAALVLMWTSPITTVP